MNSSLIQFDYFHLDITWHSEGRYHAAGIYSPSERPTPHIERCELVCGQLKAACVLEELPEEIQEIVHDQLQTELDEEQDVSELEEA